MTAPIKLPPEALKVTIDLDSFIENPNISLQNNILGQPRAQSALEFGTAIKNPGYNLFVMGDPGLGRLSMVNNHLNSLSQNQPTPPTFVYVDNFANPREPLCVQLPSGQGQQFCKDVETLIDNLLITFPAAFESPGYQQKKSVIERDFNQSYNKAVDLVEKRARKLNVALFRENEGISFAPVKNNHPVNEEQFTELPETEIESYHHHVEELELYLTEVLLDLPQWRRVMMENLKKLNHETIQSAITPLFSDLEQKYQPISDVCTYLAEIKNNLNNTTLDFLLSSHPLETGGNYSKRSTLVEMYVPNLLVNHPNNSGAPVVYEPHPTYQNLFGRIEYVSDQGTLVTSYRKICPGSMHKANGGYLILDAEKLLTNAFVWEALKRALQSNKIVIDSPYSDLGINTVTLKPQDIPLNIKIILVGSPDIYYLLEEMDSEFNGIFKILVDFDDHIPLTAESAQHFAARMTQYALDSEAKLLTKPAIQRIMEYSCRQAEHQQRLSAHIGDSLDILTEAQLFATQDNSEHIDNPHVELALAAREHRNGRLSQVMLKEMLDGTILIDTEGEAVGKINGLTIMEIGGSSFGAPARITATVYPGSRGIVDIEREVELGQAIHSKGVMILTGYLGYCYAQQFPLAISASIAIEQSYGHIDGDSASLAELCCLISALTHCPIRQYFAVTGSINQYGEVQAIGGVNEKIEGFFRLCKARGLNGKHGVIIPAVNKCNLILKQEVVEAVEQGLFSVYAVSNVDQALELLTGKPAGTIDKEGHYPEDSLNFKAISRLKEISDLATDDDKNEGQ